MKTVGSAMKSEVAIADANLELPKAMTIMAERAISSLVVREGARPVGIMSERDLFRKVLARGRDATKMRICDVMTTPVHTIGPEATTLDALRILRGHSFRRLPVVDAEGVLIGIVT